NTGQRAENGRGEILGLLVFRFCPKLCIHRDKCSREHAFAKQIAQQIWNPESGAERPSHRRVTEEEGDGTLSSEAGETSGENSKSYASRTTQSTGPQVGRPHSYLGNRTRGFRFHRPRRRTAVWTVRNTDAKLQILDLLL